MKIKLLSPEAKLPTQGTAAAAGFDLYASKPCVIESGQCVLVHTGIALEIPYGFWGGIYPRSGLSTKKGLRLANCVGVIDSDYRGEIMVALYNDSIADQEINIGDRVAQLIFHQQVGIIPDEDNNIWQITNELSETDRGTGGFGSTGTK